MPNSCKDHFGRLRVAAAFGIGGDSFERMDALVKADVDAIDITITREAPNYSR